MKRLILIGCVACSLALIADAEHPERYPWSEIRRNVLPDCSEKFEGMENWQWRDSGGEDGKVEMLPDALKWKIKVNRQVGWPSMEIRPKPLVDFKGGVLRFRLKATREGGGECPFRIIMTGEDKKINVALKPTPIGDGVWREYSFDPGDHTWQRKVDKIHFYVSEEQYRVGEQFTYEFEQMRRGAAKRDFVPLTKGNAGASLWLGDRADANDSMVVVAEGSAPMKARLHIENQLGRTLPPEAKVRFRLRNVYNNADVIREVPLGTAIADGARAQADVSVVISDLSPAYYHALADITLNGKSVLGVRKGSDDFYVRGKRETDLEVAMGVRLGMTSWIIDRIHGGGMANTRIAIPHSFDPYDSNLESYRRFVRLFVTNTEKVGEGYEAGLTGLAIAAEAYRRTGEPIRQRYAEWLMWNCCEAMFTMQDDCGGCLTVVNELKNIDGFGTGYNGNRHNSSYHADQTGEWMRALVYVARHCLHTGDKAKLRILLDKIRKAGLFLMANCRQDSDGVQGALRDFHVQLNADGSFSRAPYRQENRECDVYQPRLVAGLAYAASLFVEAGERVPEDWWTAFDATVRWMDAKMKPNGWFDWQCSDIVENGCHTFLGNIYAGEALFGIGEASRLAGREASAKRAFAAARKAYLYVTDHCTVRGKKYGPPSEFWVGPYLYWLFSDWRRVVGSEPSFDKWLCEMDRVWRVERKFRDFLRVPGYNCGRTLSNGMLNIAILGYLGMKRMEMENR